MWYGIHFQICMDKCFIQSYNCNATYNESLIESVGLNVVYYLIRLKLLGQMIRSNRTSSAVFEVEDKVQLNIKLQKSKHWLSMARIQSAAHFLMIRPVNFAFNSETAVNNSFQVETDCHTKTQALALKEFDNFAEILEENGVDITILNDTADPYTPDSIFPNNIFSYHHNGCVCVYPVFAENRRKERKPTVLAEIQEHFKITTKIYLTFYEDKGKFLEGTGSMVLDHIHGNIFACLSPRTDLEVIRKFCEKLDYPGIITFNAFDEHGRQIYHTNVMMCIADKYAVVCLECVKKEEERRALENVLRKTKELVLEISVAQMNSFAGNMLQIVNAKGEKLLVMSTRAYRSLEDCQIKKLEKFNRIIHSNLETIENNGGGSARCMLAEIFLPRK